MANCQSGRSCTGTGSPVTLAAPDPHVLKTKVYVFWECGYARTTCSKVDGLCRALDPQFEMTNEKVMRGWSHDTRSPFLSRMWLLVSVTKRELWNALTSFIQKGTILDTVGIYRKICVDLRFRMEHDVIRWGYHAAQERWRDLLELTVASALLVQDEGFPEKDRQQLEDRHPPPPVQAMEQGPRGTPGLLGSVPRMVRFQWKDTEPGDTFPDRVPFIREVVFGALGLGCQDLICAQRNNAARFFDVTMSSEEAYRRVLERGGRYKNVSVAVRRGSAGREDGLGRAGDLERAPPVHGGVQGGREGGLDAPPGLFLPERQQRLPFLQGPARLLQGVPAAWPRGQRVQGHLAKDYKNPRRCPSPPQLLHLGHSCPGQEATYATVLARAGGGPVAPRTVGEEGSIEDRAEKSIELPAPATATTTSSPGGARDLAPGRYPLTGKEASPIFRALKKSRKRRRAHEEELEKRQRTGSPGELPAHGSYSVSFCAP
ncbi:hypothetical protein SRHO_G00186960 [Serrasalmus rhombeus]